MCEVSHGAVMTHKYICILMWPSWFITSVKASSLWWCVLEDLFLLHYLPCGEATLLCAGLQEFASFPYILHYSIIIFRRSNNLHSNNLISWKPAYKTQRKKKNKKLFHHLSALSGLSSSLCNIQLTSGFFTSSLFKIQAFILTVQAT